MQTDLFAEVDERGAVASGRRELSVAVDRLRERFGTGAVGFGRERRFSEGTLRSDELRERG